MADMNELEVSIDIIEEMAEGLYKPEEHKWPNGWATLTFDMSLLSPEDRAKVYQAQRLLREVGIGFDSGSGSGGRDWELDWSLSGATIQVRPLRCMSQRHKKIHPLTSGTVYWAILSREGEITARPYCSQECRGAACEGEMVLHIDESRLKWGQYPE